MNASEMEAAQWNRICWLLSLDGVVPLYEEMGLDLPDPRRFVELLRALIIESRKTFGEELTPDISFAARVLQEIEVAFGEPTAERFYRWATTVFYWVHWDLPQWSAWDIILPRHSAQLPKGLPAERYSGIKQFREATGLDDTRQKVAALKAVPLSEWDAEMYLAHNYNNEEDPLCESDDIDPYSLILNTVWMNRFQRTWPELWSQFTEEEITLFWNYGDQLLKDEEIEMPAALSHPDRLRRQIWCSVS